MRSRPRRRKRESTHRNHAVKALAAGAAIAAGTQAYAAPIRFDNPAPGEPNHFEWGTGYQYWNALYINLPPEQQGNQNYAGYYGGFQRGPRRSGKRRLPRFHAVPDKLSGSTGNEAKGD